MGKSLLEKVENKVYWGIVGAILTLAFGFIGLYTYFHAPKPSILFEIVSESNVLDVHKRLENLTIYFKNEDIQKKNLNLRIITIQISNSGEVDILQSYFDQKMKWGFKISDGKIINDARIISSNSEYLKGNLFPKVVDDNIVELEKVILEKGKYFSIEILVLHKKDILPKISYMGKIVGIENVTPIKTWEKDLEPSFIAKFFYGGYVINVLRPIIYLILLICVIVIIAFLSDKIGDSKGRSIQRKRKREIANILGGDTKDEKIKLLADIYIHNGTDGLKQIEDFITDNDKLKNEIKYFKLEKEYEEKYKTLETRKIEAPNTEDIFISHKPDYMLSKHGRFWRHTNIENLIDKKVIELNQRDEIIVDSDFRKNLSALLQQINKKSR